MTHSANYSLDRPCALRNVPGWSVETDVIVVGFGAAGASAAIEAARAGAGVTLFEATSGNGGTSALSGGEIYLGGGGGTPIQRAAGFDDRTEDLYKYLLMAGGPNVDESKVRLYADGSLAHYEWLTAQGVEYKNSYIAERTIEPSTDDCLIWSGSEEAWPFATEARPAPRGHCPKFVGMGGGRYVMDVLAGRVVELGVDVRYDHRAVALVTDDAHRVHGLVLRAAWRCSVRPRAEGRGALHWRLRHEPGNGATPRTVAAALELPDRHRRRRLRHPARRQRRRRRDQHGRGIRHASLVPARFAGEGDLRQWARTALHKRGLLPRACLAVHHAAARRSHLAARRCRLVSADGVPGAVARRDRRCWRDLGRSGTRAGIARARTGRHRRALQSQRRARRGSALPQGAALACAVDETAARRARLPHRSLLLFELYPGRTRHSRDRRGAD